MQKRVLKCIDNVFEDQKKGDNKVVWNDVGDLGL